MSSDNFWETVPLNQMTKEQWESLCDNCGRCCLHKIEDSESNRVFFTNVVCRYLVEETCQCSNYTERKKLVPNCLSIEADWGEKFKWLPKTCAYRLLSERKKLYDWHPLVSGDKNTVHYAGISVRGRCYSDADVKENTFMNYVIDWVD